MNTEAGSNGQPFRKTRPAYRTKLFGLAVIIFAIGACDNAKSPATNLEGLWQSRGYGKVAQVTSDNVRFVEWTPVSCLPTDKYPKNRFLSEFKVQPNHQEKTFAIRNDGTLSPIIFEPLNGGFDRLCPAGLTPRTDDPELNFEVLWHTFDQHYAFFSERNVDWDAVYAEFRPQINKKTTKRELRRALDTMLERLKDAHVSLYIDDHEVISVRSRIDSRLLKECREEMGANCHLHRYLKQRYSSSETTLRTTYLKNRFKTAFKERAIWGRIGESTGYIRIDSMEGLARRHHSSNDDLAALKPVLDAMLEDLGHLPNMIVDVRFNGGGHDAVALAIASRFTEKRRVFGSKRALENGHRTKRHDLTIEPSQDPRYQGRVAVLISSETASAAEVFTLAMRSLPQVTVVGEATMGVFSDELNRSLPNGWEFSLSNEIYLAPNGELFEASGVPPDIRSPFLSLEGYQDGVDTVIEAAIKTFKNSSD